MKVNRCFMTNEFTNKKNGKKFYVQIVELINGEDTFMLKTISNFPLTEGVQVRLPYIMTDFQKFGVKVEVL